MHRTFQVTFTALLITVLMVSLIREPAAAKPDGKTTTFEIGVGTALLGNLVKLSIDNGKANRNARDAMDLMEDTSRLDKLHFSRTVPGSSATPPRSARGLRAEILEAVRLDKAALNRDQYEILRTCWNSVIVPAPADPGSGKNAAPAAPTQPSATGAVAKLDCTARDKDTDYAVKSVIDKYDASVAFSTAPSLYQQIVDLQVGSHKPENVVRIQTIYTLGELFLGYKPGPAPPIPGAAVSLSDVFTSCVAKPDLFGCIGKIGDAEASAAADHRVAVACAFARLAWLPSYSAIKLQPGPIDMDTNFGAARGCR